MLLAVFSQTQEIGELEEHRAISAGYGRFGAIGTVEDEKDVAAGAIPVVEEKIRACKFFVVVPLHKEFDKKVCGKGVLQAIAECVDVKITLRKSDPVALIFQFIRQLTRGAKSAFRANRVASSRVVCASFKGDAGAQFSGSAGTRARGK